MVPLRSLPVPVLKLEGKKSSLRHSTTVVIVDVSCSENYFTYLKCLEKGTSILLLKIPELFIRTCGTGVEPSP